MSKIQKLFGLHILQRDSLEGEIKEVIEQFFGDDANECEEFELILNRVAELEYEFIFDFGDSCGHVSAVRKLDDIHFLFLNQDLLPSDVLPVVEEMSRRQELSYLDCEAFLSELKEVGYIFEYGLDSVPFDLRPMSKQEKLSCEYTKKMPVTPDTD